jgi:UDP-N-acetyl-D-galactosamine dehydrogenase
MKFGLNVDSRVLLLGFTFKEDCPDVRNTRVIDIYKELVNFDIQVNIYDPWVDPKEVEHEYGFKLTETIGNEYDAVIVAVAHDDYKQLSADYFRSLMKENPIMIDLKNLYGHFNSKEIERWSL